MPRIQRLLAVCVLLLCATAGWAQLSPAPSTVYVWRESSGLKFTNFPPPWYEAGRKGPTVQVFRDNKLIDDTSWSAVRRQSERAALSAVEKRNAAAEADAADERDDDKSSDKKAKKDASAPTTAPFGSTLISGGRVELWDKIVTPAEMANLCKLVAEQFRAPNLAAGCDARRSSNEALSKMPDATRSR